MGAVARFGYTRIKDSDGLVGFLNRIAKLFVQGEFLNVKVINFAICAALSGGADTVLESSNFLKVERANAVLVAISQDNDEFLHIGARMQQSWRDLAHRAGVGAMILRIMEDFRELKPSLGRFTIHENWSQPRSIMPGRKQPA